MDIKLAMVDPARVFSSPEAVLEEQAINREQKIKILRQWEYDARELEVAEEENMAGGPPDLLGRILTALDQLEAPMDPDSSSAKQGGG